MMDLNKNKAELSAADDFGHDERFSDALLLQFIEGTLTAEQTAEVQVHLNECAVCAHIVGEVYYTKAHPITAEEQREAERLLTRTPEEEVAKLLNLPKKTVRPIYVPPQPRWYEKLFAPPLAGRLAFAMCAVLFVLIGQRGLHYYQTDYQYEQVAANLMKRNAPGFTDMRFSGGYTPVVRELSPTKTHLESVRFQIETALANGGDRLRGQRLLLQVLTFNKGYDEADSLVRVLSFEADGDAALANDLGVYFFKRENLEAAKRYFETAIRQDARYPEAHFNLALTHRRLGEKTLALASLAEVLALEENEAWKAAARDLQKELQSDKEE